MADRDFTHLDEEGRATMVDVGDKPETQRTATASGKLRMGPETRARVLSGDVPKGNVVEVARIAGIQAAKRTADWIPLAHSLPLDSVNLEINAGEGLGDEAVLQIEACAQAHWRTGVEMEALVAVSAAALTVYDMCKAVDRGMTIGGIELLHKSGGRSGEWNRPGARGESNASDEAPSTQEPRG